MDYRIERESLSAVQTVYSGTNEQPIDIDVTLPDYCPDISKILKCQIVPQIFSKQVTGDQLSVEGTAQIRVLYADQPAGTLRFHEIASPFSTAFNLKGSYDDAVAQIEAAVQYVNCRAVSSRKLDIHGAFNVKVTVMTKQNREFISSVSGAGIEISRSSRQVSDFIGIAEHPFSIQEVFSVSGGKQEPEAVVVSGGSIDVTEYKAIANKLIVKGEINVKALYFTDASEFVTDTVSFSVPFNQILDLEDIDDDATASISASLSSLNLTVQGDSYDENASFALDAKAVIIAKGYRQKDIQVIGDAYSTKYEIDAAKETISVSLMENRVRETFTQKNVITIDGQIEQIVHIWNDATVFAYAQTGDEHKIRGKSNICVLYKGEENSPVYIERAVEFEWSKTLADTVSALRDLNVKVSGINYHISGVGEIELKIDYTAEADIVSNLSHEILEDVVVDEGNLKKTGDAPALTLYYTDAGEKLWDIAKKYNTSILAITKENNLVTEELEKKQLLLIPTV